MEVASKIGTDPEKIGMPAAQGKNAKLCFFTEKRKKKEEKGRKKKKKGEKRRGKKGGKWR